MRRRWASVSGMLCHEIGHCLGFMHNMAASSAIRWIRYVLLLLLKNTGLLIQLWIMHVIIMWLNPGDKEKGVKLTPPDLGLYDLFTVAWSYTPLPEAKTPRKRFQF